MSDEIDEDLYRRLCERDLAAPSEFCDRYLPWLMADRRWVPPGIRDDHMITEAAIQAVLEVAEHPERYKPSRSPIQSYLRRSARADCLNLLAREQRHTNRRAPIDAVELEPHAGNVAQEEPALPGNVSQEFLMRRLREALPDPRDREAVRLILEEGRTTTADFVRIYGLDGLPVEEQRAQVKRNKDRLDKVMKRLGKQVRDGG